MSRPYILRRGVSALDDLVDGSAARAAPFMGGNTFYVDSVNGSDSNDGTKDKPFATLDYAIGKCTANHGDVIFVMAGHAESIIAAGTVTCDIAGVTIIGLGNGEDRPTFTFTTADAATFLLSAADVAVLNLLFLNNKDGHDVMLDMNADGGMALFCEFREGSAKQTDNYIDIGGAGANAADNCVVKGCKILSSAAGAASGINISQVCDGLRLEDNWIEGDFSGAGIESAAIFTNALIARNIVSNTQAGDHAIELSGAATGLLVDNRLYGDTLGTILDPGSMKCLGNLETDAIDQAGVDSPRTSAGGLADNSITAAAIATGAIDADAIADNAIDAGALAADAVAEIADGIADEALSGHLTAGSLGRAVASVEMCCEKSDGAVLGVADPIFDIAGGPIEILSITGIVTTGIGAGASLASIQLVTTVPAATVDLNAAPVDIDGDVAGTSYRTINTTGVFTPVTAGFVLKANSFATNDTTYLAPAGTLQCLTTAARTGVIKWYLRYKPLSPSSTVVAAA